MTGRDLVDAWRAARDAWPGVEVSQEELAAFALERGTSAGDDSQGDEGAPDPRHDPHYKDLYLACACARGDAVALRAFELAFFPEVDAAVAKVGGTAPSPDEIRQIVRHKLFVAEAGAEAQIVRYSGQVELRTWVRIIATRAALNVATRAARELPFESDALTFLIGSGDDPEIQYLKSLYTAEFREAFGEAFDGLESRERNLLRYAFGEGLTVDAIGSLYGVHRATAARWVVNAHKELASRLRNAMVHRLGVTGKDYSSILQLIQSRCDITLDRYLRATAE
jgi:RNA polymerase sigma-70 factor (ECF subfamily)